jgi:hypothetical protein
VLLPPYVPVYGKSWLEIAWSLIRRLEYQISNYQGGNMPIEEEWNDSGAAPEPKSQAEIQTAITRLEKLIADSPTDPAVAKGLQDELAKLRLKLK